MKKFKFILVILLALLILPFGVLAEEGDDTTDDEATAEVTTNQDDKVKIYFFRGEGCPHCAEAEEFFESIKEEYGQYFEVVDYETWYNEENAELLQKVGEFRDEEISGVPYILIGNKSWAGYATDYDEEIKAAITSEYEKDTKERYDIMDYILNGKKVQKEEKDYSKDVLALFAIIVVVGGIVVGVVFARKNA